MLLNSTTQSQQGGEQKLWISLYFSIWPLEGTVVKIGKDQNKLKKTFLPYNLKRYPDTIFYTMTCKASQTLETGSFKTASLPSSLYGLHQKKKSISPVIPPQPQSNLDSNPPVMRLLSVGNHPESTLKFNHTKPARGWTKIVTLSLFLYLTPGGHCCENWERSE